MVTNIKPVDIAQKKYKEGISEESYIKGVDAVKVNPAVEAVKRKDDYEKNTLAAESKLIKNLSAVPLDDWQTATKNSFTKLEEKVIRAVDSGKYPADKVLEAGKAAHSVVKGMKKGSYNDSYNRYEAAQKAVVNTYKK